MRALRALAPGQDHVELVELSEDVELKEGEVLVRTTAAGVCGSDVHALHGTQTYPMRFPVTLGHEATGTIAQLGPGVSGWQVGERVVSETARSVCGICRLCREGNYNLCPNRLGFGALYDGSMADYFVTRAQILHRVPESVPDLVAAVTEPYAVAYNAIVERARVYPGDVVSIIGPGPVGIFSAQIALIAGAHRVIVIGLASDAKRLAVAESYGAETVASSGEWWKTSEAASQSDVVVDATGVSSTLEGALGLVRPGGQIVKVGWGPEPFNRPLDELVAKAVDLHGSFSHTWTTWERVLRLLGQGTLSPGLALERFDFDAWRDAFGAMSAREVVKSVVVL